MINVNTNYDFYKQMSLDESAVLGHPETKRAAKSYICYITGLKINKGDMYTRLELNYPYYKKRFVFVFHNSVSKKTIKEFRKQVNESVFQGYEFEYPKQIEPQPFFC